uniref:GT23 domain-containing protein n=2 Tax=Meloidogyne enterolobii TaxID=390850 RepID=A0A6V7WZP6_MELEN|nr:unnamed protein product [Meloidogyne enterolobii]
MPQINNNFTTSKEAFSQMTLIQKQIYLKKLFGYDTLKNVEQKQLIERQIISYLSTERRLYIKQNNEQKLTVLSEKIQSAINFLQNPTNCSNASIIVCPMDGPDWGFGFLIHQICYCFLFSIVSGRTLILNNENAKLYKFNVKWNELFMPITNCNYAEHAMPFQPLKEYIDKNDTDRILVFHPREKVVKRGFDVSPTELKTFLLKYHSNPTLWFRGQLIKYIWRENELTLNATNQSVSRIPFECGPVVGIHVRRTDKISEAKFFNLEEYMTWIDFWFDVVWGHNHSESEHPNCTTRRMLFVAADLPILKDIVEETKHKWGDRYEVYHGIFNTQNDSKEAFTEILAVFRILAKCQFIVCTFSSNACQLVYELMQVYQGDAVENIHSLDYIYEMNKELEATTEYKPPQEHPIMPEELWAEKGDVIEALSPVHQDGFIRAKNYRLKKVGSFPMYLLKKHLKFENFSIFANIQ